MFFKNSNNPDADSGRRTTVLVVGGMESAECVRRAENALRAVSGVHSAGVNLLTRLSTVKHSGAVTAAMLTAAVDAQGFRATAAHAAHDASGNAVVTDTREVIASLKARFIMSAVLTALLFMANTLGPDNSKKLFLLCLLATPVQLVVGWDFYRSFFKSLWRVRFNLESLAVLASTAAFAQGMLCFLGQVSSDPDLELWRPQFHSGALVLAAVSLGKWLEALAKDSAEDLWGGVEALLPREACVLRGEREQIIPSGAVALGDIVLVGPGERIPVDGEVVDGFSHIDESPLTGDARPVSKVAGDRVAAAALNGSGVLRIRATGTGPHSTLAHISMLVERARSRKSRADVMADRIASVLAPGAIVLSLGAFFLWRYGPEVAGWMLKTGWMDAATLAELNGGMLGFLTKTTSFSEALRPAIAVLIAACPCALGLAAPAAVLTGTRIAAKRGVFFKGGDALESAARVTDVIFDQSGTLTCGKYSVREVLTASDNERDDVLALSAALGSKTKMESARSVEREARRRGLAVPMAERCEMLAGGGVGGHFGEHAFRLCPRSFVSGGSVSVEPALEKRAAALEESGASVLFLCRSNGTGADVALGAVAIEERIKEGAASAILSLRKLGVAVHLLSGESLAQARMVGRACGLHEHEIHALAGAEGKAEFTRELRHAGRRVAVVGDGASDAPALAAADVGIALSAGADAATEAAGIVLASGDVMGAVRAIEFGRAAGKVIHQNLFAALACTAVMLPLAFFNKLMPATIAVMLIASTLAIALNALRLLRTSGPREPVPVEHPRIQRRAWREATR